MAKNTKGRTSQKGKKSAKAPPLQRSIRSNLSSKSTLTQSKGKREVDRKHVEDLDQALLNYDTLDMMIQNPVLQERELQKVVHSLDTSR